MDLLEFTTLDEVGDQDAENMDVDVTVQEEVDFMSLELDEVGEDFVISSQEQSTKPGNSTSNGKIALNTSIAPERKEGEKRSRDHSRSISREKKRNDSEGKSQYDGRNTSQLDKGRTIKQPTREYDRKTSQQERGRIQLTREHDRKTSQQEKKERGNTKSGDWVGKTAAKHTYTVRGSSQSSITSSRNPKWAASTPEISERNKEKRIGDRKDEEVSKFYRTTALAQNLLDSCKDAPLLGLEYVVEVSHDTRMTQEFCNYICVLCSKMVKSVMILDHAKSVPHQMKFLDIHQPQIVKKYLPSNPKDWTGAIMRDFTFAVTQMEAKVGRHRLAVTNGKGLSSTVASIREKIRADMLHHNPEPAEQTVKQESWKPHCNLIDFRDTQERQRTQQSLRAREPESHPQHQHEMKRFQEPPSQHQHEMRFQVPPPQHQHEMKSYQVPPPQHQHEMRYPVPPPQHQHEMKSYQEPPPQHQHEMNSYQEPHHQDLQDRSPHIALYDVKEKEGAELRTSHMEEHLDSNIFHRRNEMLRKNYLKDCNSTENVGPSDSNKDNVKNSEDQFSVIGTLKILHELKDQVGSFGPAVSSLLEAAATIDQNGGRPLDLLKDPDNLDVIRFVIGKLLGHMCSGNLGAVQRARCKMALERAMVLRFQAEELLKEAPHSDTDPEHNNNPTPTVGLHDLARYSSQGENNSVFPHAVSGCDIPMKHNLSMSEAPPRPSQLLSVQASHTPRQNADLDNNYLCHSSSNSLQCEYPGSNFTYSSLDLQPNRYPAHSLDSNKPDFQQREYSGSNYPYSSDFEAPQRSAPERIEHRFPDSLGPKRPQGDYGHNYKLDPPQSPSRIYHQDHGNLLDEENMDISRPKYALSAGMSREGRSERPQKTTRLKQTRRTSHLSGKKVDQKEMDTTENQVHPRQSPNRRNKEDSNKVQQKHPPRQQQRKEERAVDKAHKIITPERKIEGTTENQIDSRTARMTELRNNTQEGTARKAEIRENTKRDTAHKTEKGGNTTKYPIEHGLETRRNIPKYKIRCGLETGRNITKYTTEQGRETGRNITKYKIAHGLETGRNTTISNASQERTGKGKNTTRDTAHHFYMTTDIDTKSTQDSDEEPGSPRRSWRFERDSRR